MVAGPIPNYGFKYNVARGGYEVDEGTISVVRRIFCMVGVEGVSTHSIARILEAEGAKSSAVGKHWYKQVVKRLILDDVYKTAFEEISDLIAT